MRSKYQLFWVGPNGELLDEEFDNLRDALDYQNRHGLRKAALVGAEQMAEDTSWVNMWWV